MSSQKIHLGPEKHTWLATLYGKALDAAAEQPILGDRFAAEAVERIDYDFASLKLPDGGDITLPFRALQLDGWARAFLAANPECVVLHLGCGLDTRVMRIDPGPGVLWFDVDLPEIIALRGQLYPDRPGYQRLATSVTDEGWLDAIPGDRPALVIGEGLFMYLPEEQGLALFRRLTEHFPRGEIVFDGYSAGMVKLVSRLATVRGSKVELVWGVGDPAALEGPVPGLKLLEVVPFLTMPELLARAPGGAFKKKLTGWLAGTRFYQNLVRHLRYGFERPED